MIAHYGQQDGIPSGVWLRARCEGRGGEIWFTDDMHFLSGSGLYCYRNGQFTLWDTSRGLSDNYVTDAFTDQQGNVWAGTNLGLNRIRTQPISSYSTEQGLANREVYPILQCSDSSIWVGSLDNLCLIRGGRTVSTYAFKRTAVQSLWQEPGGRLWVGFVGGLRWYDHGTFSDCSDLDDRNTINAIAPDGAGNVWVGSSNGLYIFRGDSLLRRYTTQNGLPGNDVKVILVGRNGDTWFGTYGGLARLKDGKFTRYTAAQGLAGDRVRSLYEDADGTLWIGTYDDGLSRLKNGRFTTYRTEQGLFNNGVFTILDDGRGNFWMSCNRGIYHVQRRELNDFADGEIAQINSVAFGIEDGMTNTECNGGRQPAGIRTYDGKLWIPTMGGIAIVDPAADHVDTIPPPVHIESVLLDRQLVDVSDGLVVQPGQGDLEINYTAISFTKSDQIKFRYRLEGKDTAWTETHGRRFAFFSYLPPGTYRFRVIAANKDGVWNNEGASLLITVAAPFYQRSWFIVLCVTLVLGTAATFYSIRIRQLERRRAEQQEVSRRLIESQEAERKRIATELHDGLGQTLLIIRSYALMGIDAPGLDKPPKEYLNDIAETSALAIDEVRQISHDLRPYRLERMGFTKAINYMMQGINRSTEVEFDVHLDNIDDLLNAESEINLYRVVQECINNILKHSGATGATLNIERDGDDGARITCGDNGRGFDPKSSANAQQHGMGLMGMAERIRIIGGTFTIESQPGAGTTVSIHIPGNDRKE